MSLSQKLYPAPFLPVISLLVLINTILLWRSNWFYKAIMTHIATKRILRWVVQKDDISKRKRLL